LDDAIAVAKEESFEDGIDIGRAMERKELLTLWRQGYSVDEAEKLLAKEGSH